MKNIKALLMKSVFVASTLLTSGVVTALITPAEAATASLHNSLVTHSEHGEICDREFTPNSVYAYAKKRGIKFDLFDPKLSNKHNEALLQKIINVINTSVLNMDTSSKNCIAVMIAKTLADNEEISFSKGYVPMLYAACCLSGEELEKVDFTDDKTFNVGLSYINGYIVYNSILKIMRLTDCLSLDVVFHSSYRSLLDFFENTNGDVDDNNKQWNKIDDLIEEKYKIGISTCEIVRFLRGKPLDEHVKELGKGCSRAILEDDQNCNTEVLTPVLLDEDKMQDILVETFSRCFSKDNSAEQKEVCLLEKEILKIKATEFYSDKHQVNADATKNPTIQNNLEKFLTTINDIRKQERDIKQYSHVVYNNLFINKNSDANDNNDGNKVELYNKEFSKNFYKLLIMMRDLYKMLLSISNQNQKTNLEINELKAFSKYSIMSKGRLPIYLPSLREKYLNLERNIEYYRVLMDDMLREIIEKLKNPIVKLDEECRLLYKECDILYESISKLSKDQMELRDVNELFDFNENLMKVFDRVMEQINMKKLVKTREVVIYNTTKVIPETLELIYKMTEQTLEEIKKRKEYLKNIKSKDADSDS